MASAGHQTYNGGVEPLVRNQGSEALKVGIFRLLYAQLRAKKWLLSGISRYIYNVAVAYPQIFHALCHMGPGSWPLLP